MIKFLPERLRKAAMEDVDLASLAVFRMFLGILVFWSAARFLINGWVDQFFATPTYFFHFWGFDWITVLPQPWMTVAFVVLSVLGLMIASGTFYRAATISALMLWTYVELIDVTNYLNHYVLVSLLLCSLAWMPAHHLWSVDAWRARRRGAPMRAGLARWMVWVLRFQIISVYFWAGMAKLSSDWLIHAQPLNIWLMSRTQLPLIGGLLEHWHVALMMSWAGFLFDSTIWLFVLWRRTRPVAYAVVVAFHLMTGLLFNIGLFPFIMMGAATILFAPDWPRRYTRGAPYQPQPGEHRPPATLWQALLLGYLLVQIAMPMRFLLYSGSVLWHEQGMRWAWKVMVREKNGSITYRLKWPGRTRALEVLPTRFVTDHQAREMSGQPDMILQLGQHIGRAYEKKLGKPVAVYVDALVSLNGRPPARLIRPDVNIMDIDDGIWPAPWILPMPKTPPAKLVSKP